MGIAIRSYTGPAAWEQVDGQDIWMGDVGGAADGHRMSIGFARLAAGTSAGIPAPYNEVWIVVKGVLTLRGAGAPVRAEAGDILYVPAATPGTVHAETGHGEEGVELVLAAHPPRWIFQEHDWAKVRAEPRADAEPLRYTAAQADTWVEVDGGPGRLAYAVDEVEEIPFGFARVPETMALEFRFPYDEVAVALTGGFTVRADGVEHTVPPGGLVYLPTGSTGTFHAEAGTTMAFLHPPTRTQGEREGDSPLPLLPQAEREIP